MRVILAMHNFDSTSYHSLDLHCSLLSEYYSMIVATRPEPTVRPPSRYQTGVLWYANSDFSCDLCGKNPDFPLCPCGFWGFCYHGVITISLYLSTYLYLYYLKMVSIVEHTLN